MTEEAKKALWKETAYSLWASEFLAKKKVTHFLTWNGEASEVRPLLS